MNIKKTIEIICNYGKIIIGCVKGAFAPLHTILYKRKGVNYVRNKKYAEYDMERYTDCYDHGYY